MKGYSFRSLTDLVLKIFKTKVNAGTGLSGGGSLEADRTLTVNYGNTAGTATQGNDSRVVNAASNATVDAKEAALEAKKADKTITITAGIGLTGGGTLAANRTLNVSYGTASGTAAQGNDDRLSNSREWAAETISQAETEAGTATTRKAFTAQRIRQAIVAWFNSISGALGRTILSRTTATQVRSDIGLGTAATRDVGIDRGNVLEVGAFGLGPAKQLKVFDTKIDSGFYLSAGNDNEGLPLGMGSNGGWMINLNWQHNYVGNRYNCSFYGSVFNNFIGFRRIDSGGEPQAPVELHHTGNLLQTTGSSTTYPMSQKATTDQLAAKAALSHTHPWSQVTDKPASATRWPTLAEVSGKPTNYPTNWATVSDKPIVQTVGSSTSNLMSQVAVTNAINNNSIGVGQTWKRVSRSLDTTYTNTTGRTIAVIAVTQRADGVLTLQCNGIVIDRNGQFTGLGNDINSVSGIIPAGATYSVTGTLLEFWTELR